MTFKKTILSDLPYCYAVCQITADGKQQYVFATDDVGAGVCFDADTGEKTTVWEAPGGTMSLVPLPNRNGDFLASQGFLPVFAAKQAKIVLAKRMGNHWHIAPWADMPYVHRFDILERNGDYYFLGCILTATDKDAADFESPGYLLAAHLDSSFAPPKTFDRIADGMHRNHGYWKFRRDGFDCAITSCDEGVFEVIPPGAKGQSWQVRNMLKNPSSDAVYIDIDGDGTDELAVIEPFHGTDLVIYKRQGNEFKEFYRYPEKMEFIHAIWGGQLHGESVVIVGCRRLQKGLFLLKWKDGKIQTEMIEYGGGASNVTVVDYQGKQRLLVANREANQAVCYDLM